MANTAISISSRNGVLVPSELSIPVVQGTSFALQAQGTPVTLFFSPDAVSALAPPPRGPVSIPDGGTASFTFTTSAEGAYSVFLEPDASSGGPAVFPVRRSSQLMFGMDIGQVGFSAQGGSMTTG